MLSINIIILDSNQAAKSTNFDSEDTYNHEQSWSSSDNNKRNEIEIKEKYEPTIINEDLEEKADSGNKVIDYIEAKQETPPKLEAENGNDDQLKIEDLEGKFDT